MSASTTKALSMAIVVALWTGISNLGNLPLQLWPVIVGLACFAGTNGGTAGVQKSILGTASGVVWAMLFVSVSSALGRQEIVQALVLGAAIFGMVYQARVPLLSYSAGAVAGAATTMGVMGIRTVTLNGGIRVAAALAIGCALGIVAERVAEMLGRMKVVPSMSHR